MDIVNFSSLWYTTPSNPLHHPGCFPEGSLPSSALLPLPRFTPPPLVPVAAYLSASSSFLLHIHAHTILPLLLSSPVSLAHSQSQLHSIPTWSPSRAEVVSSIRNFDS
eukprot:753022-Hanusia_phi.AAC.3